MFLKTLLKQATAVLALFVLLGAPSILFSKDLAQEIAQGCPHWMEKQIEEDLAYFSSHPFSLKEMDALLRAKPFLYFVKVIIKDNKIRIDHPSQDQKLLSQQELEGIHYRLSSFIEALNELSQCTLLPDTEFLISLHDSFGGNEEVPIFAMVKQKDAKKVILVPDYDALKARYQVLNHHDITTYIIPWDKKLAKLIWRGSTAQHGYNDVTGIIHKNNLDQFSRIFLCHLSQQFPHLVDAKFTFYAQGAEHIPELQQYKGKWISYERQLEYKYHLIVDGNTSAYSASGWKLFTNSLIFKADSPWIQWYYNAMIPYVHYIPVREDLTDLVDKIYWAKSHDEAAQIMAHNVREFALTRITKEKNYIYLYFLLKKYSELPKKEDN